MKIIISTIALALALGACSDSNNDELTNDATVTDASSVAAADVQEYLDYGVTFSTLGGDPPSPAVSVIHTETRSYLNFYQTRLYFRPANGDTNRETVSGSYSTDPYRFQYSTADNNGGFTPIDYEVDGIYNGAVEEFDQADLLEISSNYVIRTNNAAIPQGATHVESLFNDEVYLRVKLIDLARLVGVGIDSVSNE